MLFVDRLVAQGRAETASTALDRALDELTPTLGAGDEALALAADPLLPAAEVAELRDAVGPADDVRADGAARLEEPEPFWAADIRALADARDAAAERIRDGDADVERHLDDLVAATVAASTEVDALNVEAENQPRIAFRLARDALPVVDETQLPTSLAAYLDAAHGLEASHAEELAEKQGPLFDLRMAAESFARSLSGGVMLEFDWAPLVNGYGDDGSYGGTSYWVSDHGGYATITLSDSVAEMWPGAGVQALVAHEVGHAILSRPDCYHLFFDSDLYAGEEESWATAWAIGYGYTADGSGESIYGRPSDALIALSQQCR